MFTIAHIDDSVVTSGVALGAIQGSPSPIHDVFMNKKSEKESEHSWAYITKFWTFRK